LSIILYAYASVAFCCEIGSTLHALFKNVLQLITELTPFLTVGTSMLIAIEIYCFVK